MADNFGLKIGLEGEKEFKKQLSDINQSFKVLGSEMKLIDSQFDSNKNSVEALTAKNSVLEKSITQQKAKIDTLRNALNNASDSFGENDRRTQSWQVQLNEAQAELNKMEKELKSNNKAIEETDKSMDDGKKSAKKYGDQLEDSGKQAKESGSSFKALGEVCKGVGAAMTAAFAAVSAAAIAAGKALINMTTEGAKYADSVLTESQVTGIATDKLQEYMYAAELVDVSTDTLTKSMAKQIKSMKSAADGSSSMQAAYDALGVSVTDSNGKLRDSDEVYWELIDALGKVENETERDSLAMTILGKSAQELNPLIIAGADRLKELGKQAHEAGYVLSDELLSSYGNLDDQMQYLKNGTTALKNALGTILLPILSDLATEGTSFLAEFTRGINECNGDVTKMKDVVNQVLPKVLNSFMKFVPMIMELAVSIVTSLISAITDNLDLIVETASNIVLTLLNGVIEALPLIAECAIKLIDTLLTGIIDNLPRILEAAIQVILTLAKGLTDAIPRLIPALVKVITDMCKILIDNLPLILNAALELIKGLARGILDAIPILIDALPDLILSIVEFILNAIPEIIDAGIQLLTSLVEALPIIIDRIIEVIPQIITGIIDALFNALPQIIDAGVQLFVALIQARASFTETICKAIPELIGAIINAILGNLDKIIACGVTLFMSLIENLPVVIKEFVKAVPQVIMAIVNAFKAGFDQMKDVGENLVKGIWEGIKGLAGWIKDKVSGWSKELWGSIKDFFGIHSPSRKMAFIGDKMMEGLALGIDESAKQVVNSAEKVNEDLNSVFSDLSTDFNDVPTDFNVTDTRSGIRDVAQPNASGLTLQLSIENFNNYSSEDIESLTNEIMEAAGNFAKRKGAVFG